jgi:hypothetical protein
MPHTLIEKRGVRHGVVCAHVIQSKKLFQASSSLQSSLDISCRPLYIVQNCEEVRMCTVSTVIISKPLRNVWNFSTILRRCRSG